LWLGIVEMLVAKKITRCSSRACRISAIVASSTGRDVDAANLGAKRAGDR
jgi:hypothetical protein